jgi:hypothetical protein
VVVTGCFKAIAGNAQLFHYLLKVVLLLEAAVLEMEMSVTLCIVLAKVSYIESIGIKNEYPLLSSRQRQCILSEPPLR